MYQNSSDLVNCSNKLFFRLALQVLVINFALTFLLTSFEVNMAYKNATTQVKEKANFIKDSYQAVLAVGLIHLDKASFEALLAKLVETNNIYAVKVNDKRGSYHAGYKFTPNLNTYTFTLVNNLNSTNEPVGELVLGFAIEQEKQAILDSCIKTFLQQLAYVSIISLLFLWSVHFRITRHIKEIVLYLRNIQNNPTDDILVLNRKGNYWTRNDTLEEIVLQLNSLRLNLTHEISSKQLATDRLEFLTYYDQLTSLPNKRLFLSKLQDLIAADKTNTDEFSLILIDIDHFKSLTESAGKKVADLIIQDITKRLKDNLDNIVTIARIDLDEFILIVKNERLFTHTVDKAKQIIQLLTAKYNCLGEQYYLHLSIGISFYPKDATNAEELLNCAVTALDYAKEAGTNNHVIFNAKFATDNKLQLFKVRDLPLAVANDQFVFYCQPQVDYATGIVEGAELLLRWQHPDYGLLGPGVFIPTAEKSGHIIRIGEWMLKNTLSNEKIQQLQAMNIAVALNISVSQLLNTDFISYLLDFVITNKAKLKSFVIEITESCFAEHLEHIQLVLEHLRSHNIKIAIDDFGTGFSSLSLLHSLSIDILKIDKEFITDICNDVKKQSIVRSIIRLANDLNLKVLAEGIETVEQADFLLKEGCKYMQGYYFGRPIAVDEIIIKEDKTLGKSY